MNKDVILLVVEFAIRLIIILALPMIYKLIKKYNLEKTIRDAVWAAEQMADARLIKMPKKEYVIDYLVSKGINITIQDLDVLIEAAVKELNIAQAKQNI